MSRQDDQSEREQRLQALRALAHDQPTLKSPAHQPGGAGAPRTQLARHATFSGLTQVAPTYRSLWFVLSSAIIVVALVATLGVVFTRGHTPQAAGHASGGAKGVAITPQPDGVACPAGAAWAPNGGAIAVIGYQSDCPNSNFNQVNEPGRLIVYETGKGHTIANAAFSLDTLSQKLGVSLSITTPFLGSQAQPTLLYDAPIWSPDGQRIAIPFVVRPTCFCPGEYGYQMIDEGAPTLVGLLEVSAAGALSAVLSAPYSAAQQSVEWDTQRQKLVAPASQFAAAQSYAWSGAQVSATAPLSAKPAPGPIGAAPGAASFSLWQTGWGGIVYLASAPTPGVNGNTTETYQQIPGVYTLTPTLAAWSPGGRYLFIPNLSTLVVTLPGAPPPSAAALQSAGLRQAQQTTARDHALANLYAHTGGAADGTFTSPYALAWSPDGALLATAQSVPGDTTVADNLVTLLNTRTGKAVATLTPSASSPQNELEFNPNTLEPTYLLPHPQLAWSPDGARLFLLDPPLGTITVWKVKS